MINTNCVFIVGFVGVILYKLNFALIGYWPLILGATIATTIFFSLNRLLRKNGMLTDLPCLYPYRRPNIGTRIFRETSPSPTKDTTLCYECKERDCERHCREVHIPKEPWKRFRVHSKVNEELEKLVSAILDDNTAFLREITHNSGEIREEIQQLIRLVLSGLILRFRERLDLGELILKRLPKYFFHHFEVYLDGKRKARTARCLEENVLKSYGSYVHPALLSSDNEVKFFKTISTLLLETALPQNILNCDVSSSFLNEFVSSTLIAPFIEILADPDKINTLLIVLLDKTPSPPLAPFDDSGEEYVELLHNFAVKMDRNDRNDAYLLGVEQSDLLEEPNLLFLFQQYAKEEQFLNIVQFMINMKSFMADITCADLNDYDLTRIHDKLKYIYELFFDSTSDQYIEFEVSIQDFFTKTLNDEDVKSKILSLQNSRELYEAFDYANNILDFHIYRFYHTDIYLKLICGQRSAGGFNFDSNVQCNNEEKNNGAHDGAHELNSVGSLPHNGRSSFDSMSLEKFVGMTKNLEDYDVAIVDVNSRYHPLDGEIYMFVIQITDRGEHTWTVERQFSDFYALHAKLRLFHGDELNSGVAPLPNRKPFQQNNKALMDSFRYDLEQFLRDLFRHPSLQRSELIYNFLSLHYTDMQNFTSDHFNLGRMIKNVPRQFTKERGQHLQSFIKNFITACETAGSEPKARERCESNAKPKSKPEVFNLLEFDDKSANISMDRSFAQIEFLYDYLLLLLLRFYRLGRNWILEILLMARPFVRRTVQAYAEYRLFEHLEATLFTPERLCQLISGFRILYRDEKEDSQEVSRDALSMEHILSMTKSQRSQKALSMMKEFVPQWAIAHIAEPEKHDEVVFLLFSLLQHRLLNKQLLYLLLNSLISDLFPDVLLWKVLEQNDSMP